MKKRIKEWILRHETLYWVVVAVFAGLVFGIVTAVGCAKAYEANAAETDIITIESLGQTFEIPLEDYQYYLVVKQTSDIEWVNVFLSSAPMYVEEIYEDGTPFISGRDMSVTHYRISGIIDSSYNTIVEKKRMDNFNPSSSSSYSSMGTARLDDCIYTCNYDVYTKDGAQLVYAKNVIDTLYSIDAPYVTFDRLSVKNLIADGETSKFAPIQNMYKNYTKASTWTYYGTLNNRSSADLEYLLEATFVVEIPTVGYVQDLAYSMDVDMTREHSVLSNAPDMVYYWNNDNKAPKYTYEFVYPISITPDIDGRFSYQLTFDTIETLIMYWDEEARERINGYSDDWRAVLLSYLHVDCVTVSVKTTRPDSIVYGKVTTNQFDRGIYDVCIEVIPDIDINTATPEEIDKIIADSLQDAHDKYLADLEQRVEDLEGQLNDVGSIDGAFSGSLEGTGLWSGFKSLAGGIASLGGTVSGISSAIGSVFGFLPVDIQYVMGYTILGLCVIAIIKAIRG